MVRQICRKVLKKQETTGNLLFYYIHSIQLTCCGSAATSTPSTPKEGSRPNTPTITPQGPSQLLTALLARLPDCTNRTLIDQAAVDFTFLNSKAARKRLVKVSMDPSGR
jgi:hypothetical protein